VNHKPKKAMKILISLLLVAVLSTGCFSLNSSKTDQILEYLDLGDKNLIEMNYEEALLAYEAVIQLDPKRIEAYEGMAESYVGLKEYQKAAEILESGFKAADIQKPSREQVQRLLPIYQELADTAEAEGDSEKAILYLKKIQALDSDYDLTENEQALLVIDEKKPELEEMAKAITTEIDYDFHNDAILDPGFMEYVSSLEKPYIFEVSDGTYIGVYPGGYIYYGEMKDGLRVGKGKWFYGDEKEITVVESPWINDMPNGRAEIVSYINEALIEKEEGHYYPLIVRESVNLKSGVYEGASSLFWDMDAGRDPQHHWEVRYSDGIRQQTEGDVAAYCENCDAGLHTDGRLHKIEGLE